MLGKYEDTGRVHFDNIGKLVRVKNDTSGDLSAKYAGRLVLAGADGYEIAAFDTTTGDTQRLCVLSQDIADGEYGFGYIEGANIPCTAASDTFTAGNGVRFDVSEGGLQDTGAAYSLANANDIAEVHTGGTTVTAITVNIHPSKEGTTIA